MRLERGGMDVFYVDESMDRDNYVVCSLALPFLRDVDGTWTVVWDDQYANIRDWRKRANKSLQVPVNKELKGQKLASGRGRFKLGKHQFSLGDAAKVYRELLSSLDFLPDKSIIGIAGKKTSQLYGATRLEALVVALLQRMRTACAKTGRLGMVFFDEGHGEYRKLYRRARVYLPTGSRYQTWESGGATKNLPLSNFTKDANIKQSQHSFMIQIADIVAYALLLKIKGEEGTLTTWQKTLQLETLYDAIPTRVLNTAAATADPKGIVRL